MLFFNFHSYAAFQPQTQQERLSSPEIFILTVKPYLWSHCRQERSSRIRLVGPRKAGDAVIKYGHDIGKVVADIKVGDYVHIHNLKTKRW
jgi:hypothetical protein